MVNNKADAKLQFNRTQSFQNFGADEKDKKLDKDMWEAMKEFSIDEEHRRKRKGSVEDYQSRRSIKIQGSEMMKSLSNWKNVVEPHNRMYPKGNSESTYFSSHNELAKEMFSCISLCHELIVGEEEEDEEEFQAQANNTDVPQKSQNLSAVKKMAYQGPSPDEIAICTSAKDLGVEFKLANENLMQVQFCDGLQDWQVKMVSI